MTGHNLILPDASPPIADAPPSHVHAGRGGVRATSNKHHAPTQTEQRQPGRVRQRPESAKASRSPSPSPRIHERHRPSRRSARAELIRKARGIRRRTRTIGKRKHEPRQPSFTVRNARNCKRFWSCFISPQGSHALWAGKILRQRYDVGPPTPLQGRSWSDPEKGTARTGREVMCPT
jgi:hypothetical protein